MATLTNKRGIVGIGLGAMLAPLVTGCGPQFDPPSKLQSLRILAVKKDDPYLRPAATSTADPSGDYQPDNVAHMTLALEDARRPEDRQGELQKLWLAGCNNPVNDSYFTCLLNVWLSFKVWTELGPLTDRGPGKLPNGEGWPNQEDIDQIGMVRAAQFIQETFPSLYEQAMGQAGASGSGDAGAISGAGGMTQQDLMDQIMALRIGVGDMFDYTVPSWVIAKHAPPTDRDIPQYGFSEVFLAVCDGDIGFSPGWETVEDPLAVLTDATRGFPLTCYERGTKKERGPDNFMVSYSNLYVYEELKNLNPVVDGVEFDNLKSAATTDELGNKTKTGLRRVDASACIGQACQLVPDPPCTDDTTVPRCPRNAPKGCPKYRFKPVLSKQKNSEIDTLMSRLGGGDAQLREQMWIRYYADKGEIERDTKRLQDATEGWFDDVAIEWTVPEQGNQVAHLWSVVYDNRGGVEWARLSVCIE